MGIIFSMLSLSNSATASALNWSELALLVFGLVLVVGLVGEYKTEQHSRRMKLFEMLVIIGVAGELLADGGIFSFSHQLQVISDQEIAGANTKALDAKSSAQAAASAASVAKGASGEALDKSNAAKAAAGDAQTRAVAVSKKADQLDAQLAATQWAFSARDLIDRDKVIDQLKQFRGRTISVQSYISMGDVDGFRVCQMVLDLARSAGITPIDECAKLPPAIPPATGIRVCGPDDTEMLSLSRALSRIDIGGTCAFGKVPHSPNLTISIGGKALIAVGRTSQTIDAAEKAKKMKRHPKP